MSGQELAVDADRATLVDDHGNLVPGQLGEPAFHQRRFPGPEEPGHDGDRYGGE